MKWNSPLDAEDTYDVFAADFKALLSKEGLDHVFSRRDSRRALLPRPDQALLPIAEFRRQSLEYSKSVLKINEQAAKALGHLLSRLDPDSNAFRQVSAWYLEDATAGRPEVRGRKDYHFRLAWNNFEEEYKPDNEINLEAILKRWEHLTDSDITFADFSGQYQKLMSQMIDIGQPPTELKQLEMLRRNVKNPYLRHVSVKLSLPEATRITIEDFFLECNAYIAVNKSEDSGRKRKVDAIVARAATTSKKPRDGTPVCWRCGKAGHLKIDYNTNVSCTANTCSLCRKFIGTEDHSARHCCGEESAAHFPAGHMRMKQRADRPKKPPATATTAKRPAKSTATRGKRIVTAIPPVAATGGDPPDVIGQVSALLSHTLGRKVVFSDEGADA